MNYKIFPPSDKLKDIVKQYVVFNSLENIENVLFLPDGGNFLIFNRGVKANSKLIGCDESFEVPEGYSFNFKTNRVKQVFLEQEYQHDDGQFPIIVVELLPIGFYKLFNIDMSLSEFNYEEIPKEIVEIYFSELYKNSNIVEEFNYLNSSLIALANSHDNKRLPIEDVVDKIYNDYQLEVSVEDLLDEFGYSRSTMERNFKKMIGLTPKNFIFISKFSKTLLQYIDEKRTLRDMQYLYSDSSHMNAVFQKFLGVAPSEILKKVSSGEVAVYQLLNLKLDTSTRVRKNKMVNLLDILKYTQNIRVLYVEDEVMTRQTMGKLLKNYFNNLDIAEDGRDGLDKYISAHNSFQTYDLVISDISMPRMNGIDMSREIFSINPSQAIMIISAHCEYITSAKELGVEAILTKPVEVEDLSHTVFEISKKIYDKKTADV